MHLTSSNLGRTYGFGNLSNFHRDNLLQQTEKKLKKILWIVRSPNWRTSDLRNIATIIQANDETEARSLHSWWLVSIRYNKYFFLCLHDGERFAFDANRRRAFRTTTKVMFICYLATSLCKYRLTKIGKNSVNMCKWWQVKPMITGKECCNICKKHHFNSNCYVQKQIPQLILCTWVFSFCYYNMTLVLHY